MERKRQQPSYTAAFKLEAVKFARQSSISESSRTFGADRHSIRNWMNRENELIKFFENSKLGMNQPNVQQPEDTDQDQQDDSHHSMGTEIFTDFDGMGRSSIGHNQMLGEYTSTWKLKISALKAKNKLLEGKNRMLEGKLEKQESKTIIRTLTTQSLLNKLKQEKREILKKLKDAEDSEQMANNKLEKIMHVIQQDRTEKKLWSSAKEFPRILQEKQSQPQQQHQHQKLQEKLHQKRPQKYQHQQHQHQKQPQQHQQKSGSSFCRINLDLENMEHIHIDKFCCRLYKEAKINVGARNC